MTLLTPLGLLGLLGIAVLILIYIIRPNYLQKFVSSTFVWKLSLKYKKKRIPVSKLRNILLIICQILALASCAAILANPAKILKQQATNAEIIVILDSSASMRATYEGGTRFEEAVYQALDLIDYTFAGNGTVSVIVAESRAKMIAQQFGVSRQQEIHNSLLDMVDYDECAYGTADIDGAVLLSESLVNENPDAVVYVFTDNEYYFVPEGVNVEVIRGEEDTNIAIVNAYSEMDDNYFNFYVEIACYGMDAVVPVTLQILNPNLSEDDPQDGILNTFVIEESIYCKSNRTHKVSFLNTFTFAKTELIESENITYVEVPKEKCAYSYAAANIFVGEANTEGGVSTSSIDSFSLDNSYNLYDGKKQQVKVQYYSTLPNRFVSGALGVIQSNLMDSHDVKINEVKVGEDPELSGYDLYIFEHETPRVLPEDGVVIVFDPDSMPANTGVKIVGKRGFSASVPTNLVNEHPLIAAFNTEAITIYECTRLSYDEEEYKVLLECDGVPVFLVKETLTSKIVILPFSIHLSNWAVQNEFPIFWFNLFEHFFPSTTEKSSYEVNEKIMLKSRGSALEVSLNGELLDTFVDFPAELTVSVPGTYELSQETLAVNGVGNVVNAVLNESVYVRIPEVESNILNTLDSLPNPYVNTDRSIFYGDLLLFVAAALVTLLFAEWLLQMHDSVQEGSVWYTTFNYILHNLGCGCL